VYAGEFNEILRLFNDEKTVRAAAFGTLKKAVDDGLLELVEEVFFKSPRNYENFAEFEDHTINATHSNYILDEKLHARVKHLFEQHIDDDGAHFFNPIRVDLLRRPPL